MDSLHKDPILTFPPDNLKAVRKEYDLDKPGAMDKAIDILEIWLKKQDHFTKKDFSRSYLERSIIRAKGSVERTKERLDKMCTARTLLPQYYTIRYVKEFVDLDDHVLQLNALWLLTSPSALYILCHANSAKAAVGMKRNSIDVFEAEKKNRYDVICPKLLKDNYRLYLLHVHNTENITAQIFVEYYIKGFYLMEYLSAYDYANGWIVIFDYRKLNIYEFLKVIDIMEAVRILNVALNGYGMRVKQIHVVSPSKLVNVLVSAFKKFLTEKLASRIQVHSDFETLHQYVDKDILPEECGGTDSSLKEMYHKWADVLSSEDFLSYIKETYQYKTNESLRPLSKQNDESGLAGTFRSLSVD